MQTQLPAILRLAALGAHHEGLATAAAKLKLALGAREMHTATAGQREPKLALRTIDAVQLQMLVHALRLCVRIVGRLPIRELFARDVLVLFLPRFAARGARHRTAIRADQPALSRTCKEPGRTLNAPFEVRILHQGAIAQLPLEQIVHGFVQNGFQQQIQVSKVFEHIVLGHEVGVLHLRQFAERTRAVVDAALGDLLVCGFV